jgi:hypothetical protein
MNAIVRLFFIFTRVKLFSRPATTIRAESAVEENGPFENVAYQLFASSVENLRQDCQIFLGTTYQNWEIYTNKTYIKTPNGHKIFQIAVKKAIWPKIYKHL